MEKVSSDASSRPSAFRVTITPMQMALRARHHDHDYVASHGGWPFYSYLRTASSRAEFRVGAVERSWTAYRQAATRSTPSAELGGLGLIVLQRALLGAEDLGRLLHAVASEDPWIALRRAKIDALSETFTAAAEDGESFLGRLGLIDPAALTDLDLPNAAHAAALRLRAVTAREWSTQLVRSAGLWLTHWPLARATMHGFPILAGELIVNPPGSGELGENLRPPHVHPFAVAVTSTVKSRHVETDRHIVHLDRRAVGEVRQLGRGAAELCGRLGALKAQAISIAEDGALPLDLASRLSGDERRALRRESRRRAEGAR